MPGLPSCETESDSVVETEEGQNVDIISEIHSEIGKIHKETKMGESEDTKTEKGMVENDSPKEGNITVEKRNSSENGSESSLESREALNGVEMNGLETLLDGLNLNKDKVEEVQQDEAFVISFKSLKIVRQKDPAECDAEKEQGVKKDAEPDKEESEKISGDASDKELIKKEEKAGEGENKENQEKEETIDHPESEIAERPKEEIKEATQNQEDTAESKASEKDTTGLDIKQEEEKIQNTSSVKSEDVATNKEGLDNKWDGDTTDCCGCVSGDGEYRYVALAPIDGVPRPPVSRGRQIFGDFDWENLQLANQQQQPQPTQTIKLGLKRSAVDTDYQVQQYMRPNPRGPAENPRIPVESVDTSWDLEDPVLPTTVADLIRHSHDNVSISLNSGGSMTESPINPEPLSLNSGDLQQYLLEGFGSDLGPVDLGGGFPSCQFQGGVLDKGKGGLAESFTLLGSAPCHLPTPGQTVPSPGLPSTSPYSTYSPGLPGPGSPPSPGSSASPYPPPPQDPPGSLPSFQCQPGLTLLGTLTTAAQNGKSAASQPITSQVPNYTVYPSNTLSQSMTQSFKAGMYTTVPCSQGAGYPIGSVRLHHPPSPPQVNQAAQHTGLPQGSVPSPQQSVGSSQGAVPSPQQSIPSPQQSIPSPQGSVPSPYQTALSPQGSVPSPYQTPLSPQGPAPSPGAPMPYLPQLSPGSSQGSVPSPQQAVGSPQGPDGAFRPPSFTETDFNQPLNAPLSVSGSESSQDTLPADIPDFAFSPEELEKMQELCDIISNEGNSRSPHYGSDTGEGGQTPPRAQPGSSPPQGFNQNLFQGQPQGQPGSSPTQGFNPQALGNPLQGQPGSSSPPQGFNQQAPGSSPPQGFNQQAGGKIFLGQPGSSPPQGFNPQALGHPLQGQPGSSPPQGLTLGGGCTLQAQPGPVPLRGPPQAPQQAPLPPGLGLCPEVPPQYFGLNANLGRVLPSPKAEPTSTPQPSLQPLPAPKQSPFQRYNPPGMVNGYHGNQPQVTMAPTTLLSGRILPTATVVPVTAPITMVTTGNPGMGPQATPVTAVIQPVTTTMIPVSNGSGTITLIQLPSHMMVPAKTEEKKKLRPIAPKPAGSGGTNGAKKGQGPSVTTAAGYPPLTTVPGVDVKPSMTALHAGIANGQYGQAFHPVGQGGQRYVSSQQGAPLYPAPGGVQYAAAPARPQAQVRPQVAPPHRLHGGDDHTSKKIRLKASRYVAALNREQLLYRDDDKDTLLHIFIVRGEYFLTEAIIARYVRENLIGQMINCTNDLNQTPVYMATVMNQWEVVDKLIHFGADVNMEASIRSRLERGYQQRCPVHYAAAKGDTYLKTMEMLLNAPNMEINRPNSDGQTALNIAIQVHNQINKDVQQPIDSCKMIQLLVQYGADLNKGDNKWGKTPVHYAIEKKDIPLLQFIMSLAGPQLLPTLLNSYTFDGNTSLHFAVGLQVSEDKQNLICRMLMNGGADPTIPNLAKQMPKSLCKYASVSDLLQGKVHNPGGKKATQKQL